MDLYTAVQTLMINAVVRKYTLLVQTTVVHWVGSTREMAHVILTVKTKHLTYGRMNSPITQRQTMAQYTTVTTHPNTAVAKQTIKPVKNTVEH